MLDYNVARNEVDAKSLCLLTKVSDEVLDRLPNLELETSASESLDDERGSLTTIISETVSSIGSYLSSWLPIQPKAIEIETKWLDFIENYFTKQERDIVVRQNDINTLKDAAPTMIATFNDITRVRQQFDRELQEFNQDIFSDLALLEQNISQVKQLQASKQTKVLDEDERAHRVQSLQQIRRKLLGHEVELLQKLNLLKGFTLPSEKSTVLEDCSRAIEGALEAIALDRVRVDKTLRCLSQRHAVQEVFSTLTDNLGATSEKLTSLFKVQQELMEGKRKVEADVRTLRERMVSFPQKLANLEAVSTAIQMLYHTAIQKKNALEISSRSFSDETLESHQQLRKQVVTKLNQLHRFVKRQKQVNSIKTLTLEIQQIEKGIQSLDASYQRLESSKLALAECCSQLRSTIENAREVFSRKMADIELEIEVPEVLEPELIAQIESIEQIAVETVKEVIVESLTDYSKPQWGWLASGRWNQSGANMAHAERLKQQLSKASSLDVLMDSLTKEHEVRQQDKRCNQEGTYMGILEQGLKTLATSFGVGDVAEAVSQVKALSESAP